MVNLINQQNGILNLYKYMNEPTYKIHGEERRRIKKELGELKRYVRHFWFWHRVDCDMYSLYCCEPKYDISDEAAQMKIDKANEKIKELEYKLSILYNGQHKNI